MCNCESANAFNTIYICTIAVMITCTTMQKHNTPKNTIKLRFMYNKIQTTILLALFSYSGYANNTLNTKTLAQKPDSLEPFKEQHLQNVVVRAKRTVQSVQGAINGKNIYRDELFKAACCNLGESFVNNPSVDVNYSDATTGAKQIKLLGLSGTYVQMLTENLPNFRGAALPYGLSYVPGSWLSSIQVSKGNSSVKNGYEAMTGQINVEYLKPEDPQGLHFNLYGNTMSRFEANADGNIHIKGNKDFSTAILAHLENNWDKHDGNGDGFQDDPNVRQYNFQNRWYFKHNNYMLHAGISFLNENRSSGQVQHHETIPINNPFRIDIETNRYEAYIKNAFILDPQHGTNIALMGNFSFHKQNANYGLKQYDIYQKNAYGSLMFETNFTKEHNLSAGLSINHDYLNQYINIDVNNLGIKSETTAGAYAQYTYNLNNRLVAMAGVRIDNSNVFGVFVTPRFHIKWVPANFITLRASAGKGYRTAHALAENNFLLASGRQLVVDKLKQESAWNYGISAAWLIPVANKTFKINTEYYYTHFNQQAVVDYDSDPLKLFISNLNGRSYSHTMQIDASFSPIRNLDLTVAYRYNLVKTTYGGQLLTKPLQSRYKALFATSYKTNLELWQFDLTLALNGGGRLPNPYITTNGDLSWNTNYKAYAQLSAQITRYFRFGSVYIGGENLTAYRQKNPIIGFENPWDNHFEPTLVYAPTRGAMVYIGTRININKK